MRTLDFESDQFLQLLTDALRAGPGSPQWHEAVEALRVDGSGERDEYRLLIAARENLEKGRDYRSIRAGAGFGRKLNDALDEAAAPKAKAAPTTGVVAMVSAGLILVAAVVVLYLLFPGGTPTAAIDKLSNTYFVDAVLDANFDSSIPHDFNSIGLLPLVADRGLHPDVDHASDTLTGGAILWAQTVVANQPIAIDVSLRVNRPTDNVIAEIFVSDDPNFSDDKATSGHEFLWLYQAGQGKVALPGPDGKVEILSGATRDFKGTMNIRIALERDAAIISQQGKQVWAGAHGLSASAPRYIGLRFIQSGEDKSHAPALAFVSMKASKP